VRVSEWVSNQKIKEARIYFYSEVAWNFIYLAILLGILVIGHCEREGRCENTKGVSDKDPVLARRGPHTILER
jgi:hypothetical protein